MKRRGISISEFADDVRSGMADYELMEKYRLTSEQLQATYKQLLDSGRLSLSDLEDETAQFEPTVKLSFTCPHCGGLKQSDADACPRCGRKGTLAKFEGRPPGEGKRAPSGSAPPTGREPEKRPGPREPETEADIDFSGLENPDEIILNVSDQYQALPPPPTTHSSEKAIRLGRSAKRNSHGLLAAAAVLVVVVAAFAVAFYAELFTLPFVGQSATEPTKETQVVAHTASQVKQQRAQSPAAARTAPPREAGDEKERGSSLFLDHHNESRADLTPSSERPASREASPQGQATQVGTRSAQPTIAQEGTDKVPAPAAKAPEEGGVTAQVDGPNAKHPPATTATRSKVQGSVSEPEPTTDSLVAAIIAGKLEPARKLLDQGVDVNGADKNGARPLVEAAKSRRKDLLELLLSRGALVNLKDNTGLSALSVASEDLNGLFVKVLIAADKEKGVPLLLEACREGRDHLAGILIGHGADVNGRDSDGNTPLMFGAGRGRVELVKILLNNGADPNAVNNKGVTALEWARSSEVGMEYPLRLRMQVMMLLKERGAKFDPDLPVK